MTLGGYLFTHNLTRAHWKIIFPFYPLYLLISLCFLATSSQASEELQNQARALAQEIRCPVCLGQSIADSETSEAIHLKAFVQQRLTEGDSPSVILEKLRGLYGDDILFRPPLNFRTLFLWFSPFGLFFMIIVSGIIKVYMKRQ